MNMSRFNLLVGWAMGDVRPLLRECSAWVGVGTPSPVFWLSCTRGLILWRDLTRDFWLCLAHHFLSRGGI